jgi:hypothetical protein
MAKMAEGLYGAAQSGANQHDKCRGNGDTSCVKCVLLNAELHAMAQEQESAHKIIALLQDDVNSLKSELVQNSMLGNAPTTNEHGNEGQFSVVSNKKWKKAKLVLNNQTVQNVKKTCTCNYKNCKSIRGSS